ncbi:ribosomal 50S subunit-recycling heat shock protein [Alkalibacillus filiformis]|uniref:RQC P-site tRNA stabilizing factor n=1 Tax=Alkalibacillus filiformis TaxID=200990 RepID=A0ABU0DWI6_9BACI|nr:RNA-binding S4 domain-containing protein [Alkalibacillus filiformis]MDQ0352663.1 ribosomal 50S subunit-recycling heat shock protein [Alkalibacillus filiformis]
MRLDKFLKLSRLIKRRTVAKDVASQGRIQVNGQSAKASTDLKVGDEVMIQYGHKKLTIKVEALQEHVKKDQTSRLYSVINEEKIESNSI